MQEDKTIPWDTDLPEDQIEMIKRMVRQQLGKGKYCGGRIEGKVNKRKKRRKMQKEARRKNR